ncbi:MAG: hypothetical protein ACREMY_12815, partial [bacterium]
LTCCSSTRLAPSHLAIGKPQRFFRRRERNPGQEDLRLLSSRRITVGKSRGPNHDEVRPATNAITRPSPFAPWMRIRRVSDVLGTASGIVSIAVLVEQALHYGIRAPFETVVKWYVSIVQWLFSPIAPFVENALTRLQHWRPRDFHPSAQWRHYLVIGIVMLGASFRAGNHPTMQTAGVGLFLISVSTALTTGTGYPLDVARFLLLLSVTAVAFALVSVAVSKILRESGRQKWTMREAGAYIRSIAAIFAGAALFVVLSAGFGR